MAVHENVHTGEVMQRGGVKAGLFASVNMSRVLHEAETDRQT